MMNPEETALMRRAEERTRTAFQSVETVVGAFTSVAMMLESTYFAVQSCFRALLGVAQHFSRLKNHLWSIISAISILHRLKNWLRRLLALLRLRQYVASEELWDDITQSNLSNSNQHRFVILLPPGGNKV
jgi:peroxin-13